MGWKEEYIKNIGAVDLKLLDIESAQNLKIENLPSSLYKFRKISKYSLKNLKDSTVWLNKPVDYNDPYEFYENQNVDELIKTINNKHIEELISVITKNKPISEEILIEARESDNPLYFLLKKTLQLSSDYNDDKIDSILFEINNIVKTRTEKLIEDKIIFIQNTMKVCSFCENPKEILMWSHYSDSHKGFCVEYKINEWSNHDIRKRILFPVIYSNNLYDSTNHLIEYIKNKDFNNLYPIISGTTKSTNWEYEKEWRFIIQIGESFSVQNYKMNCGSKVYLGHKISNYNKKRILKICRENNFEVFQAKLAKDKYEIEFELIKNPK